MASPADLERAIAFATEAHAGQVDKLGEPYIDHCIRVMDAVSGPAKRVAVLHDVAEDTAWEAPQIGSRLNLSRDETFALIFLRRRDDETYAEYIELLASDESAYAVAGDLAREVKVADLQDNLSRWVPELGDDLRKRYERALARLTTEGETGA